MLFKYDPEPFRLLLAALQSNDYQLVNKRFNDMYLSFSVSVNKYIRKVYKNTNRQRFPNLFMIITGALKKDATITIPRSPVT